MTEYPQIHVRERHFEHYGVRDEQLTNGAYCDWIADMCKNHDFFKTGVYSLQVVNGADGIIFFYFRGDDCDVVTLAWYNNKLVVCAGFMWDDEAYRYNNEAFERQAIEAAKLLGLKYVPLFS